MTRDQISQYCRLGAVRNTNRVLLELSDYLQSIREGYQTIYYLSREGKAYVECDKVRKKGGHVTHTIMRNDFWIYNGFPYEWKNEIKVSDGKATIIVDAMYKKSNQQHFLEVDNIQPMRENKVKIAKYIALYNNGTIAKSLGHFPTVVWLTTTELRRKQLSEACKALPGAKIYTMDDIK
jgi:hypothetical protein